MEALLKRTQSSYYPAFVDMCKDVTAGMYVIKSTTALTIATFILALEEAADINMFLNPLRPHFEGMEECDYLELEKRLPAIMHVICLIWANSKHYQQPARLVVLLQEMANLVIDIVSDLITMHISVFTDFV